MGVATESTSRNGRPRAAKSPVAAAPGALEGRRLGRYRLEREIGRGSTGAVYEARDAESGSVVALKTLVSTDAENLFRLKHEFRSLANLEHENFVRFGELACEDGQWFFTMERIEGTDFLGYVRGGAPDATGQRVALTREQQERRLRVAIAQLVEALGALHAAGRIHRDVKPSNVLVATEGRVVLLDFGLMSGFGADSRIVGTPAYMAPEQIACEPLTAAADWYAVGVMVYAALTGELPFAGEVPAILDAKLCDEVSLGWGAGAPEDLRNLCEALLARDAQARPGIDEIRSRLGLAARARGPAHDVFVGREAELGRLRAALERARSGGAQVIVRGEPGVGKSALVERLLADLPGRSLVLRGRCYEQERVPFGGADSLIDALSEYLVGLEVSEVDRLIAGGVSSVARLFPVLCRVPLVAQRHAEGPGLTAAALREQAFRELSRMITALAATRTLAVYVDDLQWADVDTMALLRGALLSSGARFLFVATLRSGSALAPEVAAFVASLEAIDVARLSGEESRALWRALGASTDDTLSGAALCEAGGHPLFLAELVRSARAGRLGAHASSRLEDVLWERISERDPVDVRFLEMTALAGAPTSCAVLAKAAGLDAGECATRLAALRASQLVRVSRVEEERCVEPYHDRVREAVMERVRARGDALEAAMHVALGRALQAATPRSKLASQVFTIVQHLNAGRTALATEDGAREVAELDLLASHQATAATAFERAREYAILGEACLPADASSRDRDIWRDLLIARFSAELLGGRRAEARATFDRANAAMPTAEDKVKIYVRWIALEAGNVPRAALEVGYEILRELGAAAPAVATTRHVLTEYASTRWAQRGRPAKWFASAPRLEDRTTRSMLEILVAMASPAYHCEENLQPWIALRVTRVSMNAGIGDTTPFGFAGYAMTLAGAFGKHQEAAAFSSVGVAIARADMNPNIVAKAEFLDAGFIAPWVVSLAEARERMRRAMQTAKAVGDAEYEGYGRVVLTELGIAMGLELGELQKEAARAADYPGAHAIATDCGAVYGGYAAALRGETASLTTLERTGGQDGDLEASLTVDPTRFRWGVCRSELGYLAGEDAARLERRLADVDRFAHTGFSHPMLADVCMLHALVAARRCRSVSPPGRVLRVVRMVRMVRRLEGWSQSCPANFEAHALIARAELLRVLGRARAAAAVYERAMASARKYGAPKREAMAAELAMEHARARGLHAEAARHRAAAIEAYRRWGATAKAALLERQST